MTDEAIVGRANEASHLHEAWQRAQASVRQLVFVTGEIGIGKTKLVQLFLGRVQRDAWIIHGQCVEEYGTGEAYLPVIETVARLIRRPGARTAAATLSRHAPSWLRQIRAGSNGAAAQEADPTVGPHRMVHELIEALDALSRDRPVVLFLDDLHWSDWSTAALVDRIARESEPARILVIGTYRPDELIVRQHPFLRIHHELRVHQRCQEIQVPRLGEPEVAQYLQNRGLSTHLHRAARQLRHRTGGNPLFLQILCDHLVAGGFVTPEGAVCDLDDPGTANPFPPPALRDLVDDRIHRLTPTERHLLEAASVAGLTFLASAVDAAVRMELSEVERVLDSLVRRRQFVDRQHGGASSAAAAGAGYAFVHSLYQSVIYESLPPASRAALHRSIGNALEEQSSTGREGAAARRSST